MANAGIFGIVISKLSYWQEPYSFTLLKVGKDLKIGSYCIILPLNLAVYL